MNLTWYGHAAFLLEGEATNGETVRVMLDPYRAPDVGTYAPVDDVADIVAISHVNAKYHSHTAAALPRPGGTVETVDGLVLLGERQPKTVRGVPFTAVRVWEDDKRVDPISMLGVTLGGVRFLHMGDCGHALSPSDVAACGQVDVLLALAGGPPTLELTDMADFVRALKPRVVIPMHFLNDRINLKLRPVADFLALMPPDSVRHFDAPTVPLTPETLPDATEIWVLPPAR